MGGGEIRGRFKDSDEIQAAVSDIRQFARNDFAIEGSELDQGQVESVQTAMWFPEALNSLFRGRARWSTQRDVRTNETALGFQCERHTPILRVNDSFSRTRAHPCSSSHASVSTCMIGIIDSSSRRLRSPRS